MRGSTKVHRPALYVLAQHVQIVAVDLVTVQNAVAAQFEGVEGVGIEVYCPSDMVVRTGATYECAAFTDDDEPVTLIIEITNRHGGYTWHEK